MLPKPDLYSTVLFTSPTPISLDRVTDRNLLRCNKHRILEKMKATVNHRPTFLIRL